MGHLGPLSLTDSGALGYWLLSTCFWGDQLSSGSSNFQWTQSFSPFTSYSRSTPLFPASGLLCFL